MAEATALERIYLITGSDRPKIETALGRLRAHFDPGSVERLSAQEMSGGDVVASCNAGSLLGDERLLIVDGIDGRPNADGRLVNAWKAADIEAIATYAADPATTTVLALVGSETKKDSPLRAAVASCGRVLEFQAARRGRAQWVAERFRARGVQAEPEACALLVQLVGEDDLLGLAAEVDKIATWAEGEPVGEREVLALVAAAAEAPAFAVTDAWGARDVRRALEVTETLLEREARSRRDVSARLAGTLGGYLGRLRRLKRLAAEGVAPRDAAVRLKLNPYYARKLAAHADAFSDEELDGATVRLAQLDLALKGASKLAPELELERALIDVCRETR